MHQNIDIEGPHGRLSAVLSGTLAAPLVVMCHGMLSNKEGSKSLALMALLRKKEINVLRFDFTGAGDSAGSRFDMTYSRQMEDCLAITDWLATQNVMNIGLYGSSMGGTTAILTAAREERVVALATLAAPAHPELFSERYPQWHQEILDRGFAEVDGIKVGPAILEDSQEHNIIGCMRVLRCATLIVHGERDSIVPCSDAHDLAAAAATTELLIVPEADHRFTQSHHRASTLLRIAEFFAATLHST